jgi:hypothetical protein
MDLNGRLLRRRGHRGWERDFSDLNPWAREYVLETGESPPDIETDPEAWFEYSEEVAQAFFEEFAASFHARREEAWRRPPSPTASA